MIYLALQVIIYSGDGLTAQQLLNSAASNFDITVTEKFKVKLLMLYSTCFLGPKSHSYSRPVLKKLDLLCMCSCTCAAQWSSPSYGPQISEHQLHSCKTFPNRNLISTWLRLDFLLVGCAAAQPPLAAARAVPALYTVGSSPWLCQAWL